MFTENHFRFHNESPTAAAEHLRPQVKVLGKMAVVYLKMRHLTNNTQVIFNLFQLLDLNFYIFTRQSLVGKSSFLKSSN